MLKLNFADGGAPPPPDHTDPEVRVWNDLHGSVTALGYIREGRNWIHFPGFASYGFSKHGDEVTAFPCPSARREFVVDTYHRSVVPLVLQSRGTQVLHASAVRSQSGVIAVCAPAGSGKSTIAYGLSRRGHRLWADDAVAFSTAAPGVQTLPLEFRVRLLPDAAAFLGADEEPRLATPRAGARETRGPAPLSLLVVLRCGGASETPGLEVTGLRGGGAFTALLANAYCFDPGDEQSTRRLIRSYLELVAALPVIEIRFTADLARLPAMLDRIEAEIERTAERTR